MSRGGKDDGSGSPYQQLRSNRQIKIDVHAQQLDVPSSTSPRAKNVWIKPKNNSVVVPPEVLEQLSDDIERRHAGQLQAEEILWYQAARPFRESITKSWAFGLSLMLVLSSIFICVAIWFYVPSYLLGTALIPPIVAIIVCFVCAQRIRVDLAGHYALTKYRAIIIVPKRHMIFWKPMIMSFDFVTEKNLIMVLYQEARLQDTMLTREPCLADLVHNPQAIGTASFYPRAHLKIPFRFHNIHNSHAFEADLTDAMTNSPIPVGGGRLRIDKPDFEAQRVAARKYKFYPIVGAIYILFIVGIISALLWGVVYTQLKSPLNIAMVVLAWLSAVSLSLVSFYPIYDINRAKREAIANARYVKYMIDRS